MIKFIVVLSAIAALAIADEKFTTKYDNINVDEILANPRLYSKYLSCLLNEPDAKCTPDGKVLKESIPDALTNDCAKCSEKQKEAAEKIVKYMLDKKPEDYKKVEALYDKEGIFRKKYSA